MAELSSAGLIRAGKHVGQAVALRATLIIPALNEEPVLAQTLAAIPPGLFTHVLVADNGSTDKTAAIARAHGARVSIEPARGYGATCLRAIAELPDDTDIVVFMQADLSEDPREVVALLAPIQADEADLVLGSRPMGHIAPGAFLPHQVFGNWLATFLIRWVYGYRYTDLGPFRAIRKDALLRLGMKDRGYGWTVEMQVRALQHGLRIREVPVSYHPRVAGENKISGSLKASVKAGLIIIRTIFALWREQ